MLTDLKDNLKITNDYTYEPVEVKRGLFKWTDFPNKPVVCFTTVADEPHELDEYGAGARWLRLLFYGYLEDDGLGNTDAIQLWLQDVENFLDNPLHNTYQTDTWIGNIEVLEGGVSSPINSFIIEVSILYVNEEC